MHVIEIVGETIGFGGVERQEKSRRFGPFLEVAHAERVFQGKLWTRVEGVTSSNRWTAQQGPTRLIHAEIVPIEGVNEGECVDPFELPCGGVYYN